MTQSDETDTEGLHPSERDALKVFRNFPEDFQSRVLSEGDAIGQRAIAHLVQILIGRPGGIAPAELANHASGVAVLIDHRRVLFTAQHVIAGYRSRKDKDSKTVFQVGNTSFDPEPRILFESATIDLVAIELNPSDSSRFGAMVWIAESWPPSAPATDEFVAFCGFATEYRLNDPDGTIDLGAIGGLLKVATVSETRITCVMGRERIVRSRGPHVPPPGARVSGMSGGPVFRAAETLQLVGVITDFSETFEIFYFAPLACATLRAATDA